MRYTAHVRLTFSDRNLDKQYNISKVIGETHAIKVLKENLEIRHPSAKEIRLISLKEID